MQLNTTRKPFDDARVRQALNYAVDKNALVQGVLYGAGKPAASAMPLMAYADPNLAPYAYDPAKAKELLAEAGYADGFEAQVVVDSGAATSRNAAIALQAMLQQVGVKLKVQMLEGGTQWETTKAGNYDMYGATAAVNVPIYEDKILLRVAGEFNRRDGYTENLLPGVKDKWLDNVHYNSFRAGLTIAPSDSFENYLVYSYNESDEHGSGNRIENANFSIIAAHVAGTASADNYSGTSGNDTFDGLGGADTLRGLAGNDTLKGGSGNDKIYGGLGLDTLTGGAGSDQFIFDTAPGSGNVDTITDFSTVYDRIGLENAIFTAVGANGTLASGAFYKGAAAHDASDRIIYNPRYQLLP